MTNALERLRTRLAPGITLTCVENTYIPTRAGTSGVLTKVGKSYADAVKDGAPGFRYSLPTRVRDVEWLDENTVRYPIPSRPGHTVTYRIGGGWDEQDTPDELAPGMYRVRITVTNRDGVHTATEDMNPAAIALAEARPGWSVEILGESGVTIVEDDTAEFDAQAEQVDAAGVDDRPVPDCAKTHTRKTVMPFYCRRFRGHDGKCSPYTLAPLTRERWEALTPTGHCDCGACTCACPDCKTTRPAADPRTVTGTPENVDARTSARARGERAAQLGLTFDVADRQAMTGAQPRATAGDALALF